MTDQIEARDTHRRDHAIKILDVIREMIIAAGPHPAAIAVAPAVRRDDPRRLPRSLGEFVDEKLPAMCLVEKTMHQNDRLANRFAPFETVNRKTQRIDDPMPRLRHAVIFFGSGVRRNLFYRRTMQTL